MGPSAALVLSVLSPLEKCHGIIYGPTHVTLRVIYEPLALPVAWWSLSAFLYIYWLSDYTAWDYNTKAYITDTYRGGSLVVGVIIVPLNPIRYTLNNYC